MAGVTGRAPRLRSRNDTYSVGGLAKMPAADSDALPKAGDACHPMSIAWMAKLAHEFGVNDEILRSDHREICSQQSPGAQNETVLLKKKCTIRANITRSALRARFGGLLGLGEDTSCGGPPLFAFGQLKLMLNHPFKSIA